MTELKNPIEISQSELSNLHTLKCKILLLHDGLCFVHDFQWKTEMVDTFKKRWWKIIPAGQVQKTYLTHIDIYLWHPVLKYWGTLMEDRVETFLFFNDLSACRQKYVDRIKDPIEAMGYEIKKKEVRSD